MCLLIGRGHAVALFLSEYGTVESNEDGPKQDLKICF